MTGKCLGGEGGAGAAKNHGLRTDPRSAGGAVAPYVSALTTRLQALIRNQWLSCIYNTIPEQYNANIRVCAVHFMEDYFLNLEATMLACTKAVSIKCVGHVRQVKLRKTRLSSP